MANKNFLSGNEAIARGAWEAGVTVVSGYPGTPSTEVLENISKLYAGDVYCEWAPNEKVGFEVAVGASSCGARSMTTMKHVGLNVAMDPLMTFAYIGAIGGFVAVVADDPGMNSSQNEQDTRRIARLAKIPVFEPADSAEALSFTKAAFEISEEFGTPTILRSTTSVSHSRGIVSLGERTMSERKVEFEKNPQRHVPIPAWARPMRVALEERLEKMTAAASLSPLNRIEWKSRKLGVVTHGIAYQYVREIFPEASSLKLGWSFPFPDRLMKEFADGCERVLVVEELEDFLEEHLKSIGIACFGKRIDGERLVPNIGELNVDVLKTVRRKLEALEWFPFERTCSELSTAESSTAEVSTAAASSAMTLPTLPPRPPVLCPGCPHRGIFYALGKFDVVVTGDIGCYTLGVAPPLSRLDTVTCMGAGVSMAHGMEKAGNHRKVVGVVGDSTFFHSGMTGLLDIAYNRGASTIIVLDNRTTAMTGHQDNPGTGRTITGEPTVAADIAAIGRALGIKNIAEVKPRQVKETTTLLKEAIESDEPWLIIAKTPCPLAERVRPGEPLQVNKEKCRKCKLCLKLGCPGIEADGDGVRINPILCAGCKLCQQICPAGAFEPLASSEF